MLRFHPGFLVAWLALAGCGLIIPDGRLDLPGFEARLLELVDTDVKVAYKLAEEQRDVQAMVCWSAVGLLRDELRTFDAMKSETGLATRIQRLRAMSRGASAGSLVKEACKPVIESLAADALATAARLGIAIKAP